MKKSVIVAASLALASCTTAQNDPLTGRPQVNNTATGAGVGAALGALGGLLVAKSKNGDTRKSVLIGAGVGALVGAGVGNYMDRQEQELRAQLQNSGVGVTRVGDSIILNMPSNITFASDQDALNANFYPVLNSVSIILNKYPQTLLDIDGHTDSTGSADYNQQLSERRAVSVGKFLNSQQVSAQRLLIIGYGETRPIASNDTESGRAANRRVEIRISPLT